VMLTISVTWQRGSSQCSNQSARSTVRFRSVAMADS
jgi:hypothetical protein